MEGGQQRPQGALIWVGSGPLVLQVPSDSKGPQILQPQEGDLGSGQARHQHRGGQWGNWGSSRDSLLLLLHLQTPLSSKAPLLSLQRSQTQHP